MIFEKNKYIYRKWLSAWSLTVKMIVDKGRPKFCKFPREENLKHEWFIKIKRRNIQSIQHVRISHTYCFG